VLRGLLADPARREAYGAAGRRRAVGTYQWRQVVAATDDVYTSLVTPRVSSGAVR
jgi:D-inositol-3-phosphate glycosyltransferase